MLLPLEQFGRSWEVVQLHRSLWYCCIVNQSRLSNNEMIESTIMGMATMSAPYGMVWPFGSSIVEGCTPVL
jgi:hypothetical protein